VVDAVDGAADDVVGGDLVELDSIFDVPGAFVVVCVEVVVEVLTTVGVVVVGLFVVGLDAADTEALKILEAGLLTAKVIEKV